MRIADCMFQRHNDRVEKLSSSVWTRIELSVMVLFPLALSLTAIFHPMGHREALAIAVALLAIPPLSWGIVRGFVWHRKMRLLQSLPILSALGSTLSLVGIACWVVHVLSNFHSVFGMLGAVMIFSDFG